jgi:hypothetical protein
MDNNQLTFANYPVEFEIEETDILTCKGVTGKWSQIKSYIGKTMGKGYPYKFSESLILRVLEGYKIACLVGTVEESIKIINYCKKIEKNQLCQKKKKTVQP